jgi:hypothetical protein
MLHFKKTENPSSSRELREISKTSKLHLKVEFVENLKCGNSRCDGLFNTINETISVDAGLETQYKITTLAHETIHFLNAKLFSLEARPIINLSLDYANFLVQSKNLKTVIQAKYTPLRLIRDIKNQIRYFHDLRELYERVKRSIRN